MAPTTTASTTDLDERVASVMMPTYGPLPLLPDHARGCDVVDVSSAGNSWVWVELRNYGTTDIEDVREFEEADPETGEPMMMARVLIKEEKVEWDYCLLAVPTDEFRFSPTAAHEDTADYVAHAQPVRRSDLVSMGFDREQVYSLPALATCIPTRSPTDSWPTRFWECCTG